MRKNATFDPPPIPINKIRRPPKWEVFPTVLSVWERFIRNQRGGLEKEGDIFSMFFFRIFKICRTCVGLNPNCERFRVRDPPLPNGEWRKWRCFFFDTLFCVKKINKFWKNIYRQGKIMNILKNMIDNTVSGPLRTPKMEMAKMLESQGVRSGQKISNLNFFKLSFFITIFSILLFFILPYF